MPTNENQQTSTVLESLQEVLQKYQQGNQELAALGNKIFSQADYPQEIIQTGSEIANKFFEAIDSELTPEQRGQIDTLTGKERLGAAGRIWGALNGQMTIISNLDGQVYPNIGGVITKVLGNPVGFLAMGNIMYNAIQDFKDGVSPSEVFNLVNGAFGSAINGVKFVSGFFEAKLNPNIPGDTYLEKLRNYYFDIGTVNTIKPIEIHSYDVNLDTDTLTATRFTQATMQDIIATPTDGIISNGLDGISGRYTQIDPDIPNLKPITSNVNDVFGSWAHSGDMITGTPATYRPVTTQSVKPDVALDTPNSDVYSSGRFGKAMSALSIAADVGFLSSQLTDLSMTIQNGEKVTADQILMLVGTVISTVGDAVSLGGPVGQAVGAVISAVGGAISSTVAFTKLGPDSTPKEIGMAIGDFFSALIPVIPSARAIDQAIEYQKLMDSATNEVDRQIYDALHKIAALDATPIINMFHGVYDGEIKDDVRDDLIEAFGSFDDMMRDYITNNVDFSNKIEDVAKFLKQNGNTQHTQYITAFLTPEQVKAIFGESADYRSGYDVRNVDSSIQVRGKEIIGETYRGGTYGSGGYELETKSGLEILPVGKNLEEVDGRQVLDTISLGYGVGNAVEDGKRRIDTSTYVGYSKQALDMFFTEFQRQHTITKTRYWTTMGGGMSGVMGMGAENTQHSEEVVVPEWETPRVWLNLIDDMSGLNTRDGVLGNVNNRVRAVATDLIYANINTGKGDDDVLFTDILRKYSGANSIVKAAADGGEGNDVLDLSHMTDRAIKDGEIANNQVLDGIYSINENKLEFDRNLGDGKDYELDFLNFENILLTGGSNRIRVKEGSDVVAQDGSIREIKISGENSGKNDISFAGVKSAKLTFSGYTDGVNVVHGTENNDRLTIANIEGSKGSCPIRLHGRGGNDYISGGEVKVSAGGSNELYGGQGGDIIVGRGQSNILDGGEGNDFIFGSSTGIETGSAAIGKEVIEGKEGNDIIEQGGAGNEIVYLRDQKGYFIDAGTGDDTVKLKDLKGNNIEAVNGGEGIDMLDLSNVRDDRKYGRFNGGNATLGDVNVNKYNIDLNKNSITFDATSSIGNYKGDINVTGFENVIGTSISDNIIGNESNNVLDGNGGNDSLFGGAGSDTLTGNIGDDTINGGLDNDILTGGEGADKFIFEGNEFGQDIITDYNAQDKIMFKSNAMSVADIHFEKLILRDSLKNETTESLVLSTDANAVILNNWTNGNDLNIEINGTAVDGNVINNLVQHATNVNERRPSMVGSSVQGPDSITTTHSTQTYQPFIYGVRWG